MNYLQDILAQAQQGQAIDNLARTYGISSDQAQQAVEAVLPAFAVGLQRSTQTPQSFAELLGTMSRNPYGQAFNDPSVTMSARRAMTRSPRCSARRMSAAPWRCRPPPRAASARRC